MKNKTDKDKAPKVPETKKMPMDVKNKSWGSRHRAGVTKSK